MSLTPRLDKLDAHQSLVINGSFRFWQRGITAALGSGSVYVADRFSATSNVTGMVGTVAQDTTSLPTVSQSGYRFPASLKVTATTGATAIGNEGAFVAYRVEGYDYATIHGGKKVCLQFWVRAKKTGTMGINLSSDGNQHYVTSITVDTPDTWELKRVNFTTDTTSADWLFTNGRGLQIGFMLDAAGTRLTSTLEQWYNAGISLFQAPTAQTHFLSSNNDYVQITGVQLVEGFFDEAIIFTARSYESELAACQRYYEKTYNITVDPGSISDPGAFDTLNAGSNSIGINTFFQVVKRTAPTITVYSPVTGTSARSRDLTGAVDATMAASSNIGERAFVASGTGTPFSATPAATRIRYHWTADAEL